MIETKDRIFLFSWLIVPVVMVWISTNYLIGINKRPTWDNQSNPKTNIYAERPVADNLTPKEISRIKWQNQGLVTLWFDDAWASQYTIGFPLLEEKGLVGALSVPTKLVGLGDYMSWNQIKILQYKGWEITSHSRNHECDNTKINDANFVEGEVQGALEDFKAEGINTTIFVTPCGAESQLLESAAKESYAALRTAYDGLNALPVDNPYALTMNVIRNDTTIDEVKSWLTEAKNNKKWLIVVFHQIGSTNQKYEVSPKAYVDIVDTVMESGLQTVLPTQALQMIVDENQATDATPSAQTAATTFVIINKTKIGYVNAHKNADSTSAIIGKIPSGQRAEVLDEKLGWYLVDLGGDKSGWVTEGLVTKEVTQNAGT